MNTNANIKQFKLIRFVNENCTDDHIISKISIVLRRDKIEAPYYMVTKIKLSTCIDRPENGLVHAMDLLNHHRRYNLTEEKYNLIKSLIIDHDHESNQVKITQKDDQLQMVLMSKNEEETRALFNDYQELFNVIDNAID